MVRTGGQYTHIYIYICTYLDGDGCSGEGWMVAELGKVKKRKR